MQGSKADVVRWVRGQRLAARRIALQSGRGSMPFGVALARVDDLRRLAGELGARGDRARSERENLAFHLTWARLRRACGGG